MHNSLEEKLNKMKRKREEEEDISCVIQNKQDDIELLKRSLIIDSKDMRNYDLIVANSLLGLIIDEPPSSSLICER